MGRTAVVTGVRPGSSVLSSASAASRLDVVAADVRHDPAAALGPVVADRGVDLLVNNEATGTPVRGLDLDPAVLLDVLDVQGRAGFVAWRRPPTDGPRAAWRSTTPRARTCPGDPVGPAGWP